MSPVSYQPIGIVHTPFKEQAVTPIQGVFSPDSTGEVEIFPQYVAGLKDISGFSYIILIYHFHLSRGFSLVKRPFLDNEDKGIFSIRHYERPNPIGISVVRLDRVEGNRLTIGGIDIVDGTPLLDIKPYVHDFDARQTDKNGWYENAANLQEYQRTKGIRPQQ